MNRHGRWALRGRTLILEGVYPESAQPIEELESLGVPAYAPPQPALRKGARGSSVATLQTLLAANGFSPGAIDGSFGSGTEASVKAFQRARGLYPSGSVDAATWNQLSRATPAPAQPAAGGAAGAAAERVVNEARKYLGFREGPNNENPFSAYFGVHNVPWCAYFVSRVHTLAGIPLNIGSCDALLDHVRRANRFVQGAPRKGDIAFFDWTKTDHDPAEHVGIVESATSQTITTIEGNTSDGVNRRTWPATSASIVGYGRLT